LTTAAPEYSGTANLTPSVLRTASRTYWHTDAARDGLHRRVHHPHLRADVDHRRRRFVQDACEKRRHLDHQEYRERDADEQRGEFGTVVDQQVERESENTFHGGPDSGLLDARDIEADVWPRTVATNSSSL
jgi:hypothetical protein